MTYFRVPFADRVRDGLAMFAEATGRIRTHLSEGCAEIWHLRFSDFAHKRLQYHEAANQGPHVVIVNRRKMKNRVRTEQGSAYSTESTFFYMKLI